MGDKTRQTIWSLSVLFLQQQNDQLTLYKAGEIYRKARNQFHFIYELMRIEISVSEILFTFYPDNSATQSMHTLRAWRLGKADLNGLATTGFAPQ